MLSEEALEDEKYQYFTRGMHDVNELQYEIYNLQQLHQEANWYNFECSCRSWQEPWVQGEPDYQINLFGMVDVKRAYTSDWCIRPVWYSGNLCDAMPLPIQILRNELETLSEELTRAREIAHAPYEWAPGGHLYEEHIRNSSSAHRYEALRKSKGQANTDGGVGPTAA